MSLPLDDASGMLLEKKVNHIVLSNHLNLNTHVSVYSIANAIFLDSIYMQIF